MFLRSVPKTAARSGVAAMRPYRTASSSPLMASVSFRTAEKKVAEQIRAASEHAISKPTLAGIEKRWETLPPQEQADLWMQLRDRMRTDWHQLTLQEKKAGMYLFPSIYFLLPTNFCIYLHSLLDCVRPSWSPC